jgi:hypothetical protein
MDLGGHAITGMHNIGRRHSRFPDDDVDQIWWLRWLERFPSFFRGVFRRNIASNLL